MQVLILAALVGANELRLGSQGGGDDKDTRTFNDGRGSVGSSYAGLGGFKGR